MLDLNRDILPYLRRSGAAIGQVPVAPPTALTHQYYTHSVQHKAELKKVFSDKYPDYLDINRPKEKKEHKTYRQTVYRNPFRSYPGRIQNALDYIQQADDFQILYPDLGDLPGDRLETYLGRSFSTAGSAENWFFDEAVAAYLNDPNAVMLTLPEWGPSSDREYPEPKFHLIPSENVWMHRKGKLAVLCSPERTNIPLAGGKFGDEGLIIYFVDHESYCVARQLSGVAPITSGGRPRYEWEILGLTHWVYDPDAPDVPAIPWTGGPPPEHLSSYTTFSPPLHYCPAMPATKLGKKRVDYNAYGEELFESLLMDAVPHCKDGQQAKSDAQVEFNMHVSAQEWRRSVRKCKYRGCSNGMVSEADTEGNVTHKTCPSCKGTSLDISGSGLDILWVADADTGSMAVGNTGGKMPPGAPGGFIPRPIESLQEMIKELDRCERAAFTTVNMQFVLQTPLEVSGTAKRYDREELYRELNNQGRHLIGNLLQDGLTFCDCIRYGAAGRMGIQTPTALVPVRYNLENAELVREELNDAKLNKYDSTIIEALEKKLLEYTVGKKSAQFRRYNLRTQIDPFRDMIDEIKFYTLGLQYMLYQEGPEQVEAIERMWLSINFDGLVSDLSLDHVDFWEMPLKKQRDLLREANKKLIGKLTQKTIDGTMFTEVKPLALQAPVDLQNTAQTPDSFVNPK